MPSPRSSGPLFLAGLASLGITMVGLGVAAGGGMILAVILNGFSQRAAAPIFFVWLSLVCAVNVGLGTLFGGLILRAWDPGPRRFGVAAMIATAFTLPPFLLGVAALLSM